MAEPSVHVIVFSRDRPLQLHGYLTSLFHHWYGDVRVDVLMRAEPPYVQGYNAIERECERVRFHDERDFGRDIESILPIGDAPYTCFGTDDAVFVAPVDVAAIDAAFRRTPGLLGVSLRLARQVERDMFGRPQPQPVFLDGQPTEWLCWDVDGPHSAGDWAYPWEVVGTVYPTDFVRSVVSALCKEGRATSPSQLEDAGWKCWREHTDRRLMASWLWPRLVVPTVNVVQSEFGNGIVGGTALEPAFLLDCWHRGLRLDTQRYSGMRAQSWRVGDFFLRRAA